MVTVDEKLLADAISNPINADYNAATREALAPTAQPQEPPTGEQMANNAMAKGAEKADMQYQMAQQEELRRQQAAINNLFADYSRPSDDIYNDTYDKLVMSGIYGDEAHKIASRKASEYSANRLARLQMGMQTDGVTPDGYITNNGMYYLTQMQNEDPAVASLYAQGIGNMPKVAYDRQWDIAKSDHNAQNALDKAIKMAGINYQYGQMGADAQMGRQIAMLNYKSQMDDAIRKGRQEEAMQMAFNIAKAEGASDQEAQLQAYRYVLGGGGSGSRGGRGSGEGKEEKLTAAQQKVLNSFQNMFTVAMDTIENGTQEESGEAIDNLWNSVVSMRDKGEIDPDTYEQMYGYVEHLNKLRDHKYYGR